MRICFVGDSLVNGTGDDECLGWPGRVCSTERKKGADLTLYNLGVRGDTSADILMRWRKEAELRLPRGCDGRLVFSFGLNDTAVGAEAGSAAVAATTTIENARLMLAEASRWVPTLMVGPLPVTADAQRNILICGLSRRLENLCGELGIPFMDAVPVAENNYRLWRLEAEARDGIHPNGRSYSVVADAVGAWPAWRAWFDN